MSMHTVAVMGLGVRGKIHLHGLLENPDYYKVVGLCDIDEPKMKAVAEEYHLDDVPLFTDAEEMLKETRPEIFVFVTYPDLRLSVIQLAVKYGVKGISFEKPMAESLQEAKKIVKLCHDNGIKAVVCHQQKYLSQMQTLKKRIEDGEIGEITKIHVECQAWFSQLGTHYVDYILWANGGHRAKWVCGHVHGPICLDDNHPAPDYLLGTMELENGVHAYVECGQATNGRLIEGKDPGWRNHQQIPIQTPYYTEFAEWMEDDSKVHSCNIDTAYHGYEILEGMCLSALNNVRVDLPIQDLDYEPVFDRMRKDLPECDSRKMYIYDGKTPRKERDQPKGIFKGRLRVEKAESAGS